MSGASEVPALLPCPFCDNDGELVQGHRDHWIVRCVHCRAQTGSFEAWAGARQRAADAWNTRAARPVDTGREKALEEAIAVADEWAQKSASQLRLQGGEMTAQEVRTAKAFMTAIVRDLRALANPENGRG